VPELTLLFWVIKIAATPLGETAGDAVSMSMNLGYLLGTGIFAAIFLIAVVVQIKAPRFHPFIYWTTIIATTTAGTTLADFATRSLGIGYAGGSILLLLLLFGSLAAWLWTLGSVSVATVNTPKVEMFYWVRIMFSQTLGTALGDWTIVTYEPEIVELVGTLELQTFPGPPNYESIQKGDDIERHFYLKLNKPVDVLSKSKNSTMNHSETEKNVKIMQLVIDGGNSALWNRFRKVGKGGQVKILGTLFHRFTGHHHSRVLINVKEMKPLDKSSP
jgi:Repeat of Unknown Function (DUF347)/Domain of unknown function (DUF4431)